MRLTSAKPWRSLKRWKSDCAQGGEPPRVDRRLQLLRRWSHDDRVVGATFVLGPGDFHPTIRAAITAGCLWLDYMCQACCRIGEIDLRQVDRHPDASISSLIQELSCRSCRPNPPFAKLIQLKSRSAQSAR